MNYNEAASRAFRKIADEEDKRILNPIDPNIRALVLSMNGAGIETVGSCEGHLDGRRYPYPWITIVSLDPKDTRPYDDLLADFNRSDSLPWGFRYSEYGGWPNALEPSEEVLTRFGITPAVKKEYSKGVNALSRIDKESLHELQQAGFRLAHRFAQSDIKRIEESGYNSQEVQQMYANVGIYL